MRQQSTNRSRNKNGSARPPIASSRPVLGASQQVLADERASDDGMASAPEPGATPSHADISRAAYYRAQARGFESGSEVDDWLSAESALHRPQSI